MVILVVELNLAKCRLPKGPKFVFKFLKVATLEKFHIRGGGIKILGTQGWEKLVGAGRISFPSSRGELTLDDTMIQVSKYTKCCLLIQGLAVAKQAA